MGIDVHGLVLGIVAADGARREDIARLSSWFHGAGVRVHVISPGRGSVQASDGSCIDAQADARQVGLHYYDAIIVPGGPESADALCADTRVVDFLGRYARASRPVGAIGHGVRVLAAAGVLSGKQVSAPTKIAGELRGAGAELVDAESHGHGLLVTARTEAIDAFCRRLAEVMDACRRDEVEEASRESFPASDAPGGTVVT